VRKPLLTVSLSLVALLGVGGASTASAASMDRATELFAARSGGGVSYRLPGASRNLANELFSNSGMFLGTGGDKKEVKLESKSEKRVCGTKVDFVQELGLNLAALESLGRQIDDSRKQGDPVCLMAEAKVLAAAEKTSGKQAAITSEQLLKEAFELAKYRFNSAELKTVAELMGTTKESKELLAAATKAAEQEAKIKKDKDSGVAPRGVFGTVHVDSRVNTYVTVLINGYNVGTMGPMGDIYPTVRDQPYQTTMLYAFSSDGRVWSQNVAGNYSSYWWILY
jgi:hypothetical protein